MSEQRFGTRFHGNLRRARLGPPRRVIATPAFSNGGTAIAESELTPNVYLSGADPGPLDVLYATDDFGSVALTLDTAVGTKAFRWRADALN